MQLKKFIPLLISLLALLIVSCGQATQSGSQSQTPAATSQANPTSPQSTVPLQPIATRAETPVPPQNTPPPDTSGKITLRLNKQHYALNESVTVTITNGLSSEINAIDHLTNCSVVTLERLSDGKWQPLGICVLRTATRLVPIAAGASLNQTLAPTSRSSGNSNTWVQGTYHIVFSYGNDTSITSVAKVISPEFQIG
jgi:hypothetical protein